MERYAPRTFPKILLPLALVVVSANTLAVCESDRGPYSARSETCFDPQHGIVGYENYSLVEISRGSEKLIRWWLDNNDSGMIAELNNIERIFNNNRTIEK